MCLLQCERAENIKHHPAPFFCCCFFLSTPVFYVTLLQVHGFNKGKKKRSKKPLWFFHAVALRLQNDTLVLPQKKETLYLDCGKKKNWAQGLTFFKVFSLSFIHKNDN